MLPYTCHMYIYYIYTPIIIRHYIVNGLAHGGCALAPGQKKNLLERFHWEKISVCYWTFDIHQTS
jgi:hypothetical protein